MNISIEFPPLPAGYEATPDAFLQWIAENAIFTSDGEALAGQIGGDRPAEDVGIWFGEESIESFRGGEYRTITDVPVGCLLDFAGNGDAPANFLYCEGQSLVREDYPLLFAVIGTIWGTESATTFNLPDCRGRVRVGADGAVEDGPGTYEHQGITARLPSRELGSYNGFGYAKNVATYEAAPTAAQGSLRARTFVSSAKQIGSVENPNLALRVIIRYR